MIEIVIFHFTLCMLESLRLDLLSICAYVYMAHRPEHHPPRENMWRWKLQDMSMDENDFLSFYRDETNKKTFYTPGKDGTLTKKNLPREEVNTK